MLVLKSFCLKQGSQKAHLPPPNATEQESTGKAFSFSLTVIFSQQRDHFFQIFPADRQGSTVFRQCHL